MIRAPRRSRRRLRRLRCRRRRRLLLLGARIIDLQVQHIRGTKNDVVKHIVRAGDLVSGASLGCAAALGAMRPHWRCQSQFSLSTVFAPDSSESVACAGSMSARTPWYRMFDREVREISAPRKGAVGSSAPAPPWAAMSVGQEQTTPSSTKAIVSRDAAGPPDTSLALWDYCRPVSSTICAASER